MNKYIFFRTDRIGDFLLSLILLKAIKRNDKNSYIIVIASQKNYNYIKTVKYVDEIIQYPTSGIFKKILLFIKLFKNKYYCIGALDGKKRSIYFTILLRSKINFLLTYKKLYKKYLSLLFSFIFVDDENPSKIEEFRKVLNSLKYDFIEEDLNTIKIIEEPTLSLKLNYNFHNSFNLFHLDEKWFLNSYIKTYHNIEPTFEQLIFFLKKTIDKTNYDILVSCGELNNKFSNRFKEILLQVNTNEFQLEHNNNKIIFLEKLSFFDLQYIISKADTFISCHGAPTHVASSLKTKIIDIIDVSEKLFFDKWSAHFRNHKQLNREHFITLSDKIIKML